MTPEPPVPFAVDNLADINERRLGALAQRLGIRITEFTRDQVTATMPVAGNTQPFGLMHGGAYAVLGESLGSIHASYLAPAGMVAVGVDLNATHTASAREGAVTGVCRPLHVGSSLAVHEIVVTSADGRRCSTIRITNFFKPLRRD